MSFAEQLRPIGEQADADLKVARDAATLAEGRVTVLEQTVADLTSQLQQALDAATQAESELSAERLKVQALTDELEQTKRDLRRCRKRAQSVSMLVGSSLWRESGETHQQAYQRRAENWGAAPEVVRFFYSGLPTAWPVFGTAESVVSFKGRPQDIAAGKHDAALTGFFRSAEADGRPKRWCYWHEREDDIEGGAFTEAQYRAAFTRIKGLADAVGNPDLSAGTVLMGWTANPSSKRNTQKFLTDLGVQWVGWDVYPGPDAGDTRYKYDLCVAATKTAGVGEWLICETGLHEPNTRTPEVVAAWIPLACDIARELKFTSWMYFDSTVGGDFRLTTPTEWEAIGTEIRK